jgi:hypothetical protein
VEKVTVAKDELLAKLRQNREDHIQIFFEAMDGFRAKAEAELQQQLDLVRSGHNKDIRVYLSAPVDHSNDYDRAIAMIEMALGGEIVLSEHDFVQYVLDDWKWQEYFVSNSYGSTSATGKFGDRYVAG